MKRFFYLILSFLLLSPLQAVGIGPCFEIIPGFTEDEGILQAGVSCSVKFDNHPVQLNVCTDYSFIQDTFEAYITCDYLFLNKDFSNSMTFYTGIGEIAGASINKDPALILGARAVTGLSLILYDGFLEYFIQGGFQPQGRFGNSSELQIKFPFNTGLRLYF